MASKRGLNIEKGMRGGRDVCMSWMMSRFDVGVTYGLNSCSIEDDEISNSLLKPIKVSRWKHIACEDVCLIIR